MVMLSNARVVLHIRDLEQASHFASEIEQMALDGPRNARGAGRMINVVKNAGLGDEHDFGEIGVVKGIEVIGDSMVEIHIAEFVLASELEALAALAEKYSSVICGYQLVSKMNISGRDYDLRVGRWL